MEAIELSNAERAWLEQASSDDYEDTVGDVEDAAPQGLPRSGDAWEPHDPERGDDVVDVDGGIPDMEDSFDERAAIDHAQAADRSRRLRENLEFPPMNADEAQLCARQIRSGITNVSRLLLELYERDGWKALGYATWRECAMAEFGFKQSHAYRLLAAAEVERNISPIGENQPIPESVLRPLTALEPDQQREAYAKAATATPDGKPTAAQVQKAAVEFAKPKPQQPRPEPERWTPIWEIEQRVKEYVAKLEREGDDPDLVLPKLLKMRADDPQAESIKATIGLALPCLKKDLLQAINNVRDQHRQAKLQASAKVVYVEPAKAEPSETVAESFQDDSAHRGEPEQTETVAEPTPVILPPADPILFDLLNTHYRSSMFMHSLVAATIAQLEAALERIPGLDMSAPPTDDHWRMLKIGNRRELLLAAKGVDEMTRLVDAEPEQSDAPTADELAAMAEVAQEREQEDGERLAREAARQVVAQATVRIGQAQSLRRLLALACEGANLEIVLLTGSDDGLVEFMVGAERMIRRLDSLIAGQP